VGILAWSTLPFSSSIPVPLILSFKSWDKYKLIKAKVNELKVKRKYSVVLILVGSEVLFSATFVWGCVGSFDLGDACGIGVFVGCGDGWETDPLLFWLLI